MQLDEVLDYDVQILTQLGLTGLEAKIYLALSRYTNLTTKDLSRITKTSQPDIYRVVANLQRKGLVEKIIHNPASFKAVEVDIGISFLLERRKVEYCDLETKTKLLLRKFKERALSKPLKSETANFVMIPKKETIVNKINAAIEKSKKSVDIFLTWKRFVVGITSTFAENSQKAWDRGVKFRLVVESPKETADTERAMEFCRKSPLCNIRFMLAPLKTVFAIYDKKEVFIIVNPKEGLFDSPALWSNNESLMSVVQDYFEILWLTAMKEPKLDQDESSWPLVNLET